MPLQFVGNKGSVMRAHGHGEHRLDVIVVCRAPFTNRYYLSLVHIGQLRPMCFCVLAASKLSRRALLIADHAPADTAGPRVLHSRFVSIRFPKRRLVNGKGRDRRISR